MKPTAQVLGSTVKPAEPHGANENHSGILTTRANPKGCFDDSNVWGTAN
jgi:hypothetical protein